MIGVILVRCGECGDLALDPRSGTCQACVGAVSKPASHRRLTAPAALAPVTRHPVGARFGRIP